MRYVHLQKKLHDKMKELEQLNWKEKEILAGTYRNPCGSPLGAPCLSAATSACCFCPPKTKHTLDEKEKSKTISTITAGETKDKERLFYDCYRKSQSNRELHHHRSDSTKRQQQHGSSNNNNGNTTTTMTVTMASVNTPSKTKPSEKQMTSTTIYGATNTNNTTSAAAASNMTSGFAGKASASSAASAASSTSTCDPQLKPKSWDNLMTTKSFGGYGFGFGYGYFPQKQHSHGNCNTHHFSHPHHHNHHSHCNHSHSTYYYNKSAAPTSHPSSSRSQQEPGQGSSTSHGEHRHYPTSYSDAYQIITTGKPIRPGESNPGSSKTLPTMRTSGNSRTTPESFCKMEKTLSDSSLNSEHHKDFPKNMSYLNRSSENVRYSSDDEYDEYRTEKVPQNKHDIFV